MSLSPEEKALVESTYNRNRLWLKYHQGTLAGVVIAFASMSHSIIKIIGDPHSTHKSVAIFSGLLGLVLGASVLSSFLISRQRKRDEELIHFFEKHFPNECSWKQEEKILAEAEDIRLKAKVDSLIHQASR